MEGIEQKKHYFIQTIFTLNFIKCFRSQQGLISFEQKKVNSGQSDILSPRIHRKVLNT